MQCNARKREVYPAVAAVCRAIQLSAQCVEQYMHRNSNWSGAFVCRKMNAAHWKITHIIIFGICSNAFELQERKKFQL